MADSNLFVGANVFRHLFGRADQRPPWAICRPIQELHGAEKRHVQRRRIAPGFGGDSLQFPPRGRELIGP